MKTFLKMLAAMLATATIAACDSPTNVPEQAPDKAGSMSYNTYDNTIAGSGYFIARGSGIVHATGTGTAGILLDEGYVQYDPVTCELIKQEGNFWHITADEGVITINGTGETLLQGEGVVDYSGEGFEFHYKD